MKPEDVPLMSQEDAITLVGKALQAALAAVDNECDRQFILAQAALLEPFLRWFENARRTLTPAETMVTIIRALAAIGQTALMQYTLRDDGDGKEMMVASFRLHLMNERAVPLARVRSLNS